MSKSYCMNFKQLYIIRNNVSELLSKPEQKAVYISVSIFEIPKELLFREVDKNREYLINWNQRYFLNLEFYLGHAMS